MRQVVAEDDSDMRHRGEGSWIVTPRDPDASCAVATSRRWRRSLTLLVMVVAGCGAPAPPPAISPAVDAPSGVLTIGSVSFEPAREHDKVMAFAEELVSRLHPVGIGRARVVVESSLGAIAARISHGEVDLYLDSPFPVSWLAHETGAVPLLRRLKQGESSYRSVLFARRDSGLRSIDDLPGRVIAFGEPFSTSSFLLPKASLVERGLRLARFEDPAAVVPPDVVGYVFSNDSENTMMWVLKGRIVAGAVNADYFEAMAGERRGELIVLVESEEVPRNIVCCRRDLPVELRAAVEGVLLEMHLDERGRQALQRFEETSRFDRFPVEPGQALARVSALLPFVEDDLGGQERP